MKIRILLILSAIFQVYALIYAGNNKTIFLKSPENNFKLSDNSQSGFKVTNNIAEIRTFYVNTPEGIFTQLQIGGYCKNNKTGEPLLPVFNKLIEIPRNAIVEVNVISYEAETVNLAELGINYPVIPCQPSVSKSADPSEIIFQINKALYSTDNFTKLTLADVKVLGAMRGVMVGRLTICPFQYNPVSNILKIYNNLQVEIKFINPDYEKTNYLKAKYYTPYFDACYNKLINYSDKGFKDTITQYPVKYVIVSDPMFQPDLQEFVTWKIKKGFNVIEAYTDNPLVGVTTTSIKNYLQALYTSATPDDPAPSFVLLVGDIEQIPSFDGISDSHKSDMYYCEYDGNGDYFPDVYYGRFSAQNSSQLQPQIEKTLQYEQYLMPDPSFLDEVVMVAGVDDNFAPVWGNGQINYGTDNYFNAAHGLTSHTYLYETGSPITSDSSIASAAIIQDVSNGVGFANYTAHGGTIGWADPSFLTYDIPGLQNSDKYPLMIGNCCVSNTFSEPECFGEALLRANKKGAIGYIGGSNSTLWDEDYYWGVGAKEIILNPPYEANALGSYDRIFHDHGEPESDWYITNAQMNFAGNLAVSQSSSSYDLYYWEIYHLMGDPSVMTYFSVPPPLTISYLNTIIIGTPTLTVTTEPNTYVAISYNNVLYDAQFSGSSGIVTLNTSDILTYCVANLVATKQNRQPHIGTVTVVPGTTAYIIYYSHAIDDAGGNNNFQADYAENILLNLSLKNVGPLEADSVVVTLSSNDGNIVFTDNVQQWNNIPGDSVSSINGAFSFTVNDDVTDQHNVIFNLTITDINDSIWQSSFSIPLNAPELSVDFVSINDPSGNNNGSLDPGETADINIDVNNTGHSISLPAYCLLSSTSGYVTIITDSIYLGILNINSPVQDAFIISIDSLTLIGSYIDLTFQLVAGQYSATSTVILKVGLVCEDWESNSFSMYDWENGGDIPWTITSGNPYEGSFAAVSGAIGDMESSVLSITLYVLNDDSISFYKKVSSEQYYDFLFFYIDNEPVGSWSGEVDWSLSQYPVPAGQHTFKWQYSKDYYYATGGDNAMLDYIVWPTFDMSGNNIPVFVSTPVIIATPSLPYSYDIVVNDIDADDLTISAPTLPTWLTLFDNGDGTAALNGTPDSSNIGHNQVVLSAYDGIATIYQNFTIEIGVPTENWESGDFENFPWEVSGNQPWTITTGNPYEGSFSAKSGAIGDGQTSVLSIDLNIPADDQITFFKKVSCESPYFYVGNWYYWDYLEFLIDDNSIGMWAGEIDWSIEQYPVEQGLHTFKWVYSKDSSYIGGSDCAWLDFIVFPILELPTGKNEFISTDTLTLNIYPNPAKEQATIFYTVPVNRYIEIAIFNLLGEKIMTLVNQNVNKGIYTINLDTKLFNNGIYYCRLFADEQCITKKIQILYPINY